MIFVSNYTFSLMQNLNLEDSFHLTRLILSEAKPRVYHREDYIHTCLHRNRGLCTVTGLFCTCTAQHNPSCICRRQVYNRTGLHLVGISRMVHSPPQMTLTSPICMVKVVLVLTPGLDPTRGLPGIQPWAQGLIVHCASLQITSSLQVMTLV